MHEYCLVCSVYVLAWIQIQVSCVNLIECNQNLDIPGMNLVWCVLLLSLHGYRSLQVSCVNLIRLNKNLNGPCMNLVRPVLFYCYVPMKLQEVGKILV